MCIWDKKKKKKKASLIRAQKDVKEWGDSQEPRTQDRSLPGILMTTWKLMSLNKLGEEKKR